MKKAYYATETIISSLINDSYYYPETGDPATEGFLNTTLVNVEGTISTDGSKKLACLFASKLNIKEDLATVCAGPTEVHTMDGMVWDLQGLSVMSDTKPGYLRIDIDGVGKGIDKFYANISTGPSGPGGGGGSPTCTVDEAYYAWPDCTNGYSNSDKAKKTFDRMLIEIHRSGRLNVDCSQQTELCAIISGERSMFKDDED